MDKTELQNERAKLQMILLDYEQDATPFATGQQGALDRVFAEERKDRLITRIAFMDEKIARLDA